MTMTKCVSVFFFVSACFVVSVESLSLYGFAESSSVETGPSFVSFKSAAALFRPSPSSLFASDHQFQEGRESTRMPMSPWNDPVWSFRSYGPSRTVRRPTRCFLVMGKGDGKKRRKKKATSTSLLTGGSSLSASSSNKPAAPQKQQPLPQRVSTDINVPVRMQIRYAQMHKQAAKQAGGSFRQKKVQRTKYRRTWDEEEIQEKKEERKRRGQDPDWDVILNQTATSPLVIVDGYNIIYSWPRLKKHMVRGDPQRARTMLVDDLENLRSIKGWRIEVVFDGTGRSTTGPLGSGPRGTSRVTSSNQQSQQSVSKHGVRTVFTGVGVEADSYIEERCARAKNVTEGTLTGSFIVATDDVMIRLAGQSAGAYCMSASRFVDELKAMKKAISYRVEAAVAKANGQAVRPEKLRGTHFHSFGRNQILIEDKRNRKRHKAVDKEAATEDDDDLKIEIEEDEDGIPWWAKVPDPKKFKQ